MASGVAGSPGVEADLGHETSPQALGRLSVRGADDKQIDDLLKGRKLVGADGAGFEVALKALPFMVLERAESVGSHMIAAVDRAGAVVTLAHDPNGTVKRGPRRRSWAALSHSSDRPI
jgi:hypothetical protein